MGLTHCYKTTVFLTFITCAEFQIEIFMGYDFTGGRIFDFPIDFSMGLTTVQRYCAACDNEFQSRTLQHWYFSLTTPSHLIGFVFQFKYAFNNNSVYLGLVRYRSCMTVATSSEWQYSTRQWQCNYAALRNLLYVIHMADLYHNLVYFGHVIKIFKTWLRGKIALYS